MFCGLYGHTEPASFGSGAGRKREGSAQTIGELRREVGLDEPV